MAISRSEIEWIEIWIEGSFAQNVYLLRQLKTGKIELIDPHQSNKVVDTFSTYEDATNWLNEDEYDLVEGRYIPD